MDTQIIVGLVVFVLVVGFILWKAKSSSNSSSGSGTSPTKPMYPTDEK